MATLNLGCAHCGMPLLVDAAWAGQFVNCPACGSLVGVPWPAEPSAVGLPPPVAQLPQPVNQQPAPVIIPPSPVVPPATGTPTHAGPPASWAMASDATVGEPTRPPAGPFRAASPHDFEELRDRRQATDRRRRITTIVMFTVGMVGLMALIRLFL